MTAIAKLISIASDALIPKRPDDSKLSKYLGPFGSLGQELARFLVEKNGCCAYASCLLLRPFQNSKPPLGLIEWNESELWKGEYNVDLDEMLFFAEDVFGSQFCLFENHVCTFDPETAQVAVIAESVEDWAQLILDEYEVQTGYPVGIEWQMQHEPLSPGIRLLPKKPFVVGGKFEVENLYECNDVEGMQFRASISNQIADLPDGAEIVFEVVNARKTDS